MSNYAESTYFTLGNLTWEERPSLPNINSLKRIFFYISMLGTISIGLLALSLLKRTESNDWGSFLSVEFSLIVMTVSMFIMAWMVRKHAHHQEQSRWVLYEQGIELEQGDRVYSARYEHLKIWQFTSTVSGYGMQETTQTSLVQFPGGHEAQTTNQQTGDLLQNAVARSQLPMAINAYQSGEQLDFSDFQLNAEGVAINNHWLRRSVWFPKVFSEIFSECTGILKNPTASKYKLIPWDRISCFKINDGKLVLMGFHPRSIEASVKCSDISNLYVLLNLLKHLEYLREDHEASPSIGLQMTASPKLVGMFYIVSGVILAIPGNYWIYHYVQDLEAIGGTVRMHFIFALMYGISGKLGIVTLILSMSIYLVYQGIRETHSQD